MHSVKATLLIVLLVIPNTTWRDWQNAHCPALASILQHAYVGEMMPRTAETDTITAPAEVRTVLAGARMNASGDTSKLDYPVLSTNLIDALSANGWTIDMVGPPPMALIEVRSVESTDIQREFVLRTISSPLDSQTTNQTLNDWVDSVNSSGPGSELIVMSGCPSPSEYTDHERLCPIAIWQPSYTMSPSRGLLTSPSTRTDGLVANTDLALTIAHTVGIETLPGPVYGTQIYHNPSSQAEKTNIPQSLADSAQTEEIQQMSVPYIAAGLGILIALVTLTAISIPNRLPRNLLSALAISTPIALVFAPTDRLAIAVTIFIALFALPLIRQNANRIAWLCTFTLLIAIGDAVFNHSLLIARSLMGYSYQEGARYYGLGNEAMGAMVGAAAVLTAVVAQNSRIGKWFGAAVWLILGAIFADPLIGAKAGGVLVVGVSLAAYLFITVLPSLKSSAKLIVAILAISCMVGAVFTLVAVGHNSTDSHVALAMRQTHQFGHSAIISLVWRKLSMDIRLMTHSTWMIVLIVSLFAQYVAKKRWLASNTTLVSQTWLLGLVATFACLVLNDAGVVAAALCSLFPLSALAALSAMQSKM